MTNDREFLMKKMERLSMSVESHRSMDAAALIARCEQGGTLPSEIRRP